MTGEQKTNDGAINKSSTTASPVDEIPKTDQEMVHKLENAAARLEMANKKFEQNKILAEAEKVETTLAGNASAGQEPVKPKEETPQEYAKKIMAGEQ